MIEKMIAQAKKMLPLRITEASWDFTSFKILGPNWDFKSLSFWRISAQNEVFGCYDHNAVWKVSLLADLEIVDIEIQGSFIKMDPIFILSNGQKLEIFSTDTPEPWSFNIHPLDSFRTTTGIYSLDKKKFPCPCCSYLTLSDPFSGTYELCPICYWEDDGVQFDDIDYEGAANEQSLRTARLNFKEFETSSLRFLPQVRKPLPNEIP